MGGYVKNRRQLDRFHLFHERNAQYQKELSFAESAACMKAPDSLTSII
jgi:hypothetical protein